MNNPLDFQSYRQFDVPGLSLFFSILGFISLLSILLIFPLSENYNFMTIMIILFSSIISSLIFFAIALIIRKLNYIEYLNNLILINLTRSINNYDDNN